MGLEDTFHFDEAKYRAEVSQWSPEQLCTAEKQMLRKGDGAVAAGLAGVFVAGFTAGVSLLGSAYATRRAVVASKKLKVIQQEIEAQGLRFYQPGVKDEFLAVVPAVVGAGAGFGVDALAAEHGHAALTLVGSHAAHAAAGRAAKDGLIRVVDQKRATVGKEHSYALVRDNSLTAAASVYRQCPGKVRIGGSGRDICSKCQWFMKKSDRTDVDVHDKEQLRTWHKFCNKCHWPDNPGWFGCKLCPRAGPFKAKAVVDHMDSTHSLSEVRQI